MKKTILLLVGLTLLPNFARADEHKPSNILRAIVDVQTGIVSCLFGGLLGLQVGSRITNNYNAQRNAMRIGCVAGTALLVGGPLVVDVVAKALAAAPSEAQLQELQVEQPPVVPEQDSAPANVHLED